MYKVNIRTIKNTDKFIQMVKNSSGSVFLEMPDETLCDLKQNTAALQMLRMIIQKMTAADQNPRRKIQTMKARERKTVRVRRKRLRKIRMKPLAKR